jgi:tripartite-type tricarboxylate transporter receptor subunit TctC
MTLICRLILALLVGVLAELPATADVFPSHLIKIVVPYPPGGTTDILSRIIGDKLSQSLGQPVIVENRPGGNAVIAQNVVAKAEPDGHTIGMFLTTLAVDPFVIKDLPYDTTKDLRTVSLVAVVPGLMVTNAQTPANNLQDVIKLAKTDPGKLNYGSPGPLTSGHLSMELLNEMANINIVHIPFKGGAPSVLGLLQNQVQFVIGGPPSLMPHVKAGQFKAVAVTTAHRMAELPDVPTVAEQGLKDYDTFEWYGLFAPAGTPQAVVDKLNREINRIIELPDVKQKIIAQGAEPQNMTPAEFNTFFLGEMKKWEVLVRERNLKLQQ